MAVAARGGEGTKRCRGRRPSGATRRVAIRAWPFAVWRRFVWRQDTQRHVGGGGGRRSLPVAGGSHGQGGMLRCRAAGTRGWKGMSETRRRKAKSPEGSGLFIWRRGSESNRRRRICNPLHNHFATPPKLEKRESESLSLFGNWSGKRGSNSRPQPWQGCALPTELFPRICGMGNEAWSGKRGSNSRPQPWQGCALPTELFPRCRVLQQRGALW